MKKDILGLGALAREQRRRRGLRHILVAARGWRTRAAVRAGACARLRVEKCAGMRAGEKARSCDRGRGSAPRRLPEGAGLVQTCVTPSPGPPRHPRNPETRWAARGTSVDLELSVALAAHSAGSPAVGARATAPVGKGNGGGRGGTLGPRRPLPSLDLRSLPRWRGPGGQTRGPRRPWWQRRAGRALRSPWDPGWGGGETEEGGKGEGRQGRGGAARPAPLPNRKVGLAEVPPPRRAHSAPLRPPVCEPRRRREPAEGTQAGREGPELGT